MFKRCKPDSVTELNSRYAGEIVSRIETARRLEGQSEGMLPKIGGIIQTNFACVPLKVKAGTTVPLNLRLPNVRRRKFREANKGNGRRHSAADIKVQ